MVPANTGWPKSRPVWRPSAAADGRGGSSPLADRRARAGQHRLKGPVIALATTSETMNVISAATPARVQGKPRTVVCWRLWPVRAVRPGLRHRRWTSRA